MNKNELEQNKTLSIQYNEMGLAPAIVQDSGTGEILMFAWINPAALQATLDSSYATFWSRSRNELWKKGETSGNQMKIREILIDCDQDCLIFKVDKVMGGACHTKNLQSNYRHSCFYRKVDLTTKELIFIEQ